jgi:Transposase IS116/IS110/IS902 family
VIIAALNGEIATMERQVTDCFRRHPDAAIYLSQPGIGDMLGARQLGEFGDDRHRHATVKARKNYAATSPITRQSGKKKTVLARFVRNDRLADALHRQAQSALISSPGARAYYDEQRGRGLDRLRAAGPVQPADRDLARPPEDRHPLRRSHRLVTPREIPAAADNQNPGVSLPPDTTDQSTHSGLAGIRVRGLVKIRHLAAGLFLGAAALAVD